jgi:hypothetical protein
LTTSYIYVRFTHHAGQQDQQELVCGPYWSADVTAEGHLLVMTSDRRPSTLAVLKNGAWHVHDGLEEGSGTFRVANFVTSSAIQRTEQERKGEG